MSNQSSVEWLYQEFERIDKEFHVGSHEYNYAKNLALKISKAMHREEIIKSMSFAFIDGAKIGAINYESPFTDWEQYYNETFGGNNDIH